MSIIEIFLKMRKSKKKYVNTKIKNMSDAYKEQKGKIITIKEKTC